MACDSQTIVPWSSLERFLQTLFEQNLDRLLGIRCLASEHRTTTGRIDTLGVDENFSPVIIEYKRARTRTSSIRVCSTSIGSWTTGANSIGW
jgi:RecB family endonuclease NucS